MLRHAAILAVAVISALLAAQAMTSLASARSELAAPGATHASAALEAAVQETGAQGSAAQVSKASDGHFWAQASVNGRWVEFLVDTGASSVALTADDARRLGIDLAALTYDRPVVTANGQTKAAAVMLDHVVVAGARVNGVKAMVVPEGLQTSLLGMSYLGRLSRFEATRDALILRP